MGLTWVEAVIRNLNTGRHATVKAPVDAGVTLTVISHKVADELRLPVIGRSLVQTAKGVVELEARFGFIEIMGGETPAGILVSDEVNTVLIGITVFEQLGLEVDPVTGKLRKTKLLLL
jgi:predicted aspartyl protease